MNRLSQTNSIFAPRYLALTIGIILAAMTIGFEGLAVTTVAPVIASELDGIRLFGWIFSAYLLAQIVGTMVIGREVDRKGPALLFTIALVIFSIGLVLAAVANDMYVLIGARAIQGFGAGAMYTCIYSAISISYPDHLRPKILGALGTAYVLPAMLGPYVAGVIAQQFSWRLVFWGVLPFLAIAALLSLPAFRKIILPKVVGRGASHVIGMSILLAIGTGVFLSGLGMLPSMLGIGLSLVGILLLMRPLFTLLPKGTLTLKAGLPSLIASRGLFFAAYVCTQNFLVLALTETKGISADKAGLIVASAALSWCIIAILQARWDEKDKGKGRNRRIIIGIMLMMVGIVIMACLPVTPVMFAVIGEIIAGIGIGLAHTTSGTVAFSLAKEGESGKVSGGLQFADSFTPGVAIGIGGAMIALNQTAGSSLVIGITFVMLFILVMMILSLVASIQTKRFFS